MNLTSKLVWLGGGLWHPSGMREAFKRVTGGLRQAATPGYLLPTLRVGSGALLQNCKVFAANLQRRSSYLLPTLRVGPALLALLVPLSLTALGPVSAAEVVRNVTLTDGQQLYASDLHSLIDTATIGVGFYLDQAAVPSLNAGYYFLVLDPTGTQTVYRRIDCQTALYGNTNIFINVPLRTLPQYGSFLFFDPTNGVLGRVQGSNLVQSLASNIPVNNLAFATTNNAGASNVYVLTNWVGPFSGAQTNNQPMLLVWDTNGVPWQLPLSNFEAAAAVDLGTNLSLPFQFAGTFLPWTVYGTNTWTNAWGYYSNFPIVGLTLTNAANPTNAAPTLNDGDTVPVLASAQGTNTTMSLAALYAYMTNRNALPQYTQARVQFVGSPFTYTITSVNLGANSVTNTGISFTNPTAVSFQFAYGNVSQFPTSPQVTSNAIYYAVTPAGGGTSWRLYTNYWTALGQSNAISLGTPSGTHPPVLYWITNLTEVNADVIQVMSGTSVRTGVYDVYFRTPAPTPLYYVSGCAMQNDLGAYATIMNLASDYLVTTNMFRIATTAGNNSAVQAPIVQVLVSPQ